MKMKTKEFECFVCEETFEKALTDEEAEEQLKKEFPSFTAGKCHLVCDDCFKARI